MKRTLALVLALVMVIGMMAVPASADFKDAAEIQYNEAVDVVAACGIIEGDGTGDFNPTGALTRAAGAKLVAYLELGAKAAAKLTAVEAPFVDVPADHWAAGYIGWAVGKGYIAGVGDGKFDPDAPLSALAYAKLLLCALGYDAAIEGYTGVGYEYNILSDALDVDLFDGNDDVDVNAVCTREEAALYTFNALNAKMVKYDSKGTTVEINGAVISTGASAAEETKDLLREKRYEDLEKIDGENVADKFGRPAVKWEYDGEKIGTYTEKALATYAGADFDKDTLEDDFEDWTGIDGTGVKVLYNGAEGVVDYTKLCKSINGYEIEVYGDDDDEIIDLIVVAEAYVAIINEIELDDDDEVAQVSVDVLEYVTKDTLEIDVEDDEDAYDLIKGYEEDDVLMVYLAPGWEKATNMDATVLKVADVDSIEGEVTSCKLDSNFNGWIKVDGTKYDMANEYSKEDSLKTEFEGVIYLYNGYVVHVDGDANAEDSYAFVNRVAKDTDKWGVATYVAEIVFSDGTVETVEIDEDSYNAVVKEDKTVAQTVEYDYDEEDDIYTLTPAGTKKGSVDIEKGKVGKLGANSDTVFVIIELDDDDKADTEDAVDTVNVYTGYKNVKSVKATAWVVDDYVFAVFAEDISDDSSDLIYVAKESISDKINDKDLGDYYTANAVVDGKIVEIMMDKNSYTNVMYDGASIDSDNIYSFAEKNATTAGADYIKAEGVNFKKAAKEVITLEKGDNETKLAYADDVAVYVVDTDGDITTGSINKSYSNVNVLYTVDEDTDEVTAIYIEKLA